MKGVKPAWQCTWSLLVQGYHEQTIYSPRALVPEAQALSFTLKTFTIAFGGFDGGADLLKGGGLA